MDITKEFRKEVIKEFMSVNTGHRRLVEKSLQCTGVYRSQHQLLMYISRHQNSSQREIAEGMDVSPATIAVSIKKLEKAGFIEKIMDVSDNRYNKIVITEKGNEIVQMSRQIFGKIDVEMLQGFTKEELDQLLSYMNRLKENLNRTPHITLEDQM